MAEFSMQVFQWFAVFLCIRVASTCVASMRKWTKDLFKICLENKVSLDLKALIFVYVPCTNCSFPCSFMFSSFMWTNMSTPNANSQSLFLSLSSGNSLDFPTNSKNFWSPLWAPTLIEIFSPNLTSGQESGKASPGDLLRFPLGTK